MASLRALLHSREYSTTRGNCIIVSIMALTYWLLGEVPFRLPVALMITIIYIATFTCTTAVYQICHVGCLKQAKGILAVCAFLLLIPVQLVLMFTYGATGLYVLITLLTLLALGNMRAAYKVVSKRK